MKSISGIHLQPFGESLLSGLPLRKFNCKILTSKVDGLVLFVWKIRKTVDFLGSKLTSSLPNCPRALQSYLRPYLNVRITVSELCSFVPKCFTQSPCNVKGL